MTELPRRIVKHSHLPGASERSLGHNVRMAYLLLQRELAGRASQLGLTLMEWYTLRVLWEVDAISQAELAGRAGIPESAMVGAVQSLMRQGHVTRARAEKDKRKFIVSLTEHGRGLQEAGVAASILANEAACEGLTAADDVDHCLHVLQKACDNLRR
ncbi:MarR family transcriptional regulator [Paracoccus sp. S-4012]|uniref:MarR family winged helix-turn-helix transcriptional regulator n=1 Tax=Paracoccus sp. S-4012 TaxID=2665648 RepID=UPI0012AF01CE|nr:MarR family winged helix-turn-helix transcriptional regulator [Paracoccus sp. S-4012]MRX51303.1 MarR family transcriptional regulator [Paracoccus sp. S-4012]